jgi:hypothetical protein
MNNETLVLFMAVDDLRWQVISLESRLTNQVLEAKTSLSAKLTDVKCGMYLWVFFSVHVLFLTIIVSSFFL